MRKLVLVAMVLACVVLWLPAAASATADGNHGLTAAKTGVRVGDPEQFGSAHTGELPGLLVSPWSWHFAVRPISIITAGDGSSIIGERPGRGGRIRWKTWSPTRAYGAGTFWINDGRPNMAQGTLHPHRATLKATRVRHGHYTSLTIRYRGGSRGWDKGDILHVDRLRLTLTSGSGYSW